MRKTAVVLAAAALAGSASLAYAATDTGAIADINQSRHTISLNDRSTFMAPKMAHLSRFKVGEQVTVVYAKHAGANYANRISRALGSNADLGG